LRKLREKNRGTGEETQVNAKITEIKFLVQKIETFEEAVMVG